MKKRMNKDERQAIINLVVAKAKEKKTVEIEAKLVKEKSYLELKKLNNEIKKLEEKKKLVNTKIWGIQNELNSKYNLLIFFTPMYILRTIVFIKFIFYEFFSSIVYIAYFNIVKKIFIVFINQNY